ncbi:MAG: hypothetical protein HKO66_04795 [Saprospiraceae bacterium]|nr:hypothetical protein [Bacteroidia bacterium]NNE13362.1 hypothetical protein [Saprospiraceae bacterium]NNL91529.1 hypothetical protein [Saprospiraceae bacterium]
MNKSDLKDLPIDKLKAKEKNTKTLIGVYIPIILAMLFFLGRDYIGGKGIETTFLVITICAFGGLASLLSNLKVIREEIENRS